MTHGPEAIHELVERAGWKYPVSVDRLEREYPLVNVTIDEAGNSIMVAELFEETDVDRIESREDVYEKFTPVFERLAEERKESILQRLKRTFLGYRDA